MKRLSAILSLGIVAVVATALIAAEGIKLEGITCLFGDKPAQADKSVDYKGGKVFFCCENCPKNFSKDPAKHAVAANKQLFATGQFVQKACPLSGGKLKDSTAVKVGGVEVKFCCENCQGKVAKSEAAAAAELVFADKAFEKGFELKKK